ncbi:MAG: histidine kinase [Eubacteriales bacterium]|nr:histidine kinase [Eubacteriales bacterium]
MSLRLVDEVLEVAGILMTSIVIMLCMAAGKHREKSYRKFTIFMIFSLLNMLFDLLSTVFRYHSGSVGFYGERISVFLSYAFGFLLVPRIFDFLTEYISQKVKISRRPNDILNRITGAAMILLVLNIECPVLYSFDPHYVRGQFFYVNQALIFTGLMFCAVRIKKNWRYLEKYEQSAFLICLFLTIPNLLIQIPFNSMGTDSLALANAFSGIIVFVFLQMEREKEIARKERQLMEEQIYLSTSQIQPHFISNALNTIQYLCDVDPEQAGIVTGKFARFLRMNIKAMSSKNPVDFERELVHLENYLAIEQLRFPEISYCYDIKVKHFRIPPMTLQPLVENAVRHGICKNGGKGTVWITTEREEKSGDIILRIADDGCGFDVYAVRSAEQGHIGLENSRTRVELMCKGTMEIVSEIGKGTTVTIRLPDWQETTNPMEEANTAAEDREVNEDEDHGSR